MRSRKYRSLAVGTAALAMVLAASCSSRGTPSSSPVSSSSALGLDLKEFRVLFLKLQLGVTDQDDLLQFQAMIIGVSERSVTRCMAASGFQYQPSPREAFVAPGAGSALSEADRVAKYGFGISTDANPPAFQYDDPNVKYVAELSLSAQKQFTEAENQCRTAADADIRAALILSDELQRQISDIASRISASSELSASRTTYEACMKAKGYEVTDPDDARNRVLQKFKLQQQAGLPQASQALQSFELSIAFADLECGPGYRAVYKRVRQEAEEDFLNRHPNALPTLDR